MPRGQVSPALLMAIGKLEEVAKPAVDSVTPQQHRSPRLFIKEKIRGHRFLVDSGADVSLIPAAADDKIDDSVVLYAANNTRIETCGVKILTIDLGLRRKFQWPFIVAKINKGILGADFIKHYNLLIDLHNGTLIDHTTKLIVRGNVEGITDGDIISTMDKNHCYYDLLKQYPELTKPNLLPTHLKHNVKHEITTKGEPVYCRTRPLDPKRMEVVKAEFEFMLDNGIIRPSSSQWASPLHVVTKPDGSLRPCGDYRRLNDQTIPDRYPLPRIDDFLSILPNTTIFSKVDLYKAYYQIPMAEADKCKTAIITPFGLYEFNVMSFGLRNAPATFQRFINMVCRGLNFVFAYLDDILVASSSPEEHEQHLKILFDRLDQYGLRINASKSEFGLRELVFLGFLITKDGTKPLPQKVQAILDYNLPETLHDLRTFLGLLNFYRRYLKNAADTQAILHEYLKGAKKNDRRKVDWTEDAIKKFEKCKQDLANVTLLAFPRYECPLALFCDASNFAIGSVLQQKDSKLGWQPIAFYSKKLNNAQKNYSTYDRELLSIYLSIKQYRHYLDGRDFTIFTDHKPLVFAFKQNNDKASPRQLRHLQYISQFTTNIEHIDGKDNIVADKMSRIESVTYVDYDAIAKAQVNDDELKTLQTSSSLKFKPYVLPSGMKLWCDISTNNIRPYIPNSFRKTIFEKVHNSSHDGIKTTVRNVTSKFIWNNVKKDVKIWARCCLECQRNKVTRHTKAQFSVYSEPDERFDTIHIDLIGPLPPSEGNTYCLTCIDRFTDWMEVIPISDQTAQTVAKAFYTNWIARFGVPHTVICDRGAQFKSELFKNLSNICGINLQHTTAYHPQCNGKIERLHRTLKSALKSHNSVKWTETLPTVLLGMRTALRDDKNYTISQMVYGTNIKIPGQFLEKSDRMLDPDSFVFYLQNAMNNLRPRRRSPGQNDHVFVHKDLYTCTHVFIRVDRVKKPLESSYEGPSLVTKRFDKYFTVVHKGRETNVSVDRLKPAYIYNENNDSTSVSIPPDFGVGSKPTITRSGRRVRFTDRFK